MKTALLVGLGSFVGGISRYLISKLITEQVTTTFPFGTFTVNVVGCFLIGLVYGWGSKNVLELNTQFFLTTGILGGFTTFSAFSIETFNLMNTGQSTMAITYVALSVAVGLLATFTGYVLMRL
jgi:fluoride exporter